MGEAVTNQESMEIEISEEITPAEGLKKGPSSLLRIATAGSVDDGKSTLLGRLLIECGGVYEDQIFAARSRSTSVRNESMALAFLTDGLKAEREQGITIDVAYRHFQTKSRRFILADTPGHEQYTRNMATGASTADVSLLLVDASKGITAQTKRHAFISSLLGVPRCVVAVNKMDIADFSEKTFRSIRAEFEEFAEKLTIREIRFIPVSALEGDNVTTKSDRMPWYNGETLLSYLENVYVAGDKNLVDFRFPVASVLRPDTNYRGYMGTVASGRINVGDAVIVLPSGKRTTVEGIDLPVMERDRANTDEAHIGMSVTLRLKDEVDISRGDMIARELNTPKVRQDFDAMVVWMADEKVDARRHYLLQHTTRNVRAFVREIRYTVDINNLHRTEARPLGLNDIGRVRIETTDPICIDTYRDNRATGGFILIDSESFRTVAAGMIVDRMDESAQPKQKHHLHSELGSINRTAREARFGSIATTFWLTGLSGSGKSTIAKRAEQELFEKGVPVYRLDGDNLRQGICSNLGFSASDRSENIRRAAEIAALFNDAGITVICSLISPFKKDRELAKQIIGAESFIEAYVNAPLEVCEERDPHGLYQKARSGEIAHFTGISAPFEAPENPDLILESADKSVEELTEELLAKRE